MNYPEFLKVLNKYLATIPEGHQFQLSRIQGWDELDVSERTRLGREFRLAVMAGRVPGVVEGKKLGDERRRYVKNSQGAQGAATSTTPQTTQYPVAYLAFLQILADYVSSLDDGGIFTLPRVVGWRRLSVGERRLFSRIFHNAVLAEEIPNVVMDEKQTGNCLRYKKVSGEPASAKAAKKPSTKNNKSQKGA